MIEIPQNFPGQQEGDKIVLFVRKHWIKYAIVSIISILMFSIPIVVIVIYLLSNSAVYALSTEIITASIGIFLLIVMFLIIQAFVDFYLDLFIVTEDRIIFVRQNGFFDQQIDEAHISNIDEVGVDIRGFIKSMLGYGNVVIHMGNDEAILTIDDVPNPTKIAREIMRLHKEYADRSGGKEKEEPEKESEKK